MHAPFVLCAAVAALGAAHAAAASSPDAPINVVLFLTDDQGIGDVGCYGSVEIATPHIDRLAAEGMLFTDFHVSQAVCTASRASLLTGCFAERVSLRGALSPSSRVGLHPDETTIAEVLRPLGYRSAIFGKWHLGHHREFLPLRQGFDVYHGLPYSNDMWAVGYDGTSPELDGSAWGRYPSLRLIDGDEPSREVRSLADQAALTEMATTRALDFIEANADRPFFLYVPYSMPHVPLGRPLRFAGKSEQGAYGDVIAEIDASVGRVLDALDVGGLAERTLVIFTSDNGPWLIYGDHAGSAGPFREGKQTVWEGGTRVPCLMRLPGRIPAGSRCDDLTATVDVLPTIAELTGAELPPRPIDGVSLVSRLDGTNGDLDERVYPYYWGGALLAIRRGPWKLVLPHRYPSLDGGEVGSDGFPGRQGWGECGLELYDLDADPGETTNVAEEHPDVVEALQALAEEARAELGDTRTKKKGRGVRPPGRLDPTRPSPVEHLGCEGRVTLLTEPSARYPADGARTLIDGYLGSEDFTDGRWLGYREHDFDAIVDLGSAQRIRSVECSFLESQPSWIFLPSAVEVAVSSDGEGFTDVRRFEPEADPSRAAKAFAFTAAVNVPSARYVRLRAARFDPLPEGHPGAGQPAWLFVDEIRVD
ncbi:MAG: sulfatase-like hydrolase/transferase [Planctomycetota bacterium]